MYEILEGDCLETMKSIADGSIQTCVTSPPYFGLRDYGHDGQIGLEQSPEEYVSKLVEVFRQVKRVLRDDGTLWLNLGDSYNGSGGAGGDYAIGGLKEGQPKFPGRNIGNLKPKDLMGIPWLTAFALRADGWYLRSDIIWHKPNPMPESVSDRPTKSHEYIFLLSKSREYFYDADAIREPSESKWEDSHYRYYREKGGVLGHKKSIVDGKKVGERRTPGGYTNGRNKRSVWTVTTKPYAEAHFATFPPDLIEPCILAGTSAHGCCVECGSPWERITESHTTFEGGSGKAGRTSEDVNASGKWAGVQYGENIKLGPVKHTKTLGWQPTCTCNADVVPCTVLDPFCGSGTTGAVSLKHHRRFIGCELNPSYIELAKKRIEQMQPLLLGAV